MKTSTLDPRVLGAAVFAVLLSAGSLHGQERPQNNIVVSNQTYGSGASVTESALVSIETAGAVAVNTGANVTYEAGGRIILKPGFRAAEGSRFRAAITYKFLSYLDDDGVPMGLKQDSNNNGVSDLIEYNFGLNPAANNDNDPRIQQFMSTGGRDYQYDANGRLIAAPERGYQMDAEGNIKGR